MPWVITNGKNYVYRDGNNKIATTPNVNLAITYKDRQIAMKNCLCLPRAMKHLDYGPLFVEMTPAVTDVVQENKIEVATIEEKPAENVIQAAAKAPSIDDKYLDLDTFIAQTSNFQEFVRCAAAQIPLLADAIKRTELEIIDIEHAIEFSQCNVVGGYRWYKMLRDARERRRKYKDALMCINILTTDHPDLIGEVDASRQYKGMKHRKYTPMVLIELTDYFKEREGAAAV